MKTYFTLLVLASICLCGCGVPLARPIGAVVHQAPNPQPAPAPAPAPPVDNFFQTPSPSPSPVPSLGPDANTLPYAGEWRMCGGTGTVEYGPNPNEDRERIQLAQRLVDQNSGQVVLTIHPDGSFQLLDFNLQTMSGIVQVQDGRFNLYKSGVQTAWFRYTQDLEILTLREDDGFGHTMVLEMRRASSR